MDEYAGTQLGADGKRYPIGQVPHLKREDVNSTAVRAYGDLTPGETPIVGEDGRVVWTQRDDDGGGGGEGTTPDAEAVLFDASATDLQADNVQAALVALADRKPVATQEFYFSLQADGDGAGASSVSGALFEGGVLRMISRAAFESAKDQPLAVAIGVQVSQDHGMYIGDSFTLEQPGIAGVVTGTFNNSFNLGYNQGAVHRQCQFERQFGLDLNIDVDENNVVRLRQGELYIFTANIRAVSTG